MRSAAQSAATATGSGAGRSQRKPPGPPLILGEIPAKGIALVEIFFGQAGGDLVFYGQVFFVPIGLHLINVETRIVIERQLQRADLSLVAPQLAQAALVIALLLA